MLLDKNISTKNISERRLEIHYALIQGIYWAIYASTTAYIVVLLKERGFNNTEIGYINAARTSVSVIAQIILSTFADKHKNIPLKYIITIMMSFALISNMVFKITSLDFIQIFIIFLVFGISELSIISLMDSMALQFINDGRSINYSACRGIGSVSYAVLCIFLGRWVDLVGVEIIIKIHEVSIIAYIILLITFPTFKKKKQEKKKERKENTSNILKMLSSNSRYTFYLIGVIFTFAGYMGVINFLSNLISNVGGNNTHLGMALFVMAICEVPMMVFLFPKLYRKLSADKLVFISMLVQVIRSSLLMFAKTPEMIIGIQALEIMAYGLYVPASIYFINKMIAEKDCIKGQTLGMMASSFGGTIGTALFGIILDKYNINSMLIFSCFFTLTGAAFMFISIKLSKKTTATTDNEQLMMDN